MVDNPAHLPDENRIEAIEEPFILASIHVPEEFLGAVMQLCEERRGVQRDLKYLGAASRDSCITRCRWRRWFSTFMIA